MIRTYTPDKARMRLSKHHTVADYWTSRSPTIKLSDDVARVISILEDTLSAPVEILFAYDTEAACKKDGKELCHSRGMAVDIAPTGKLSYPDVLYVLETLVDGQGIIGYYNRGRDRYIHFEVTKLPPKRWVYDRRGVKIPVASFASLHE